MYSFVPCFISSFLSIDSDHIAHLNAYIQKLIGIPSREILTNGHFMREVGKILIGMGVNSNVLATAKMLM